MGVAREDVKNDTLMAENGGGAIHLCSRLDRDYV